MADLVPANLTPQEQAEFNQATPAPAAPQGNSVLQALSAPELAELAVKDKDNFDLINEFRSNQDAWSDPALVQKVADAHNLIKQRGFKFSDLPGPVKIAGQAFDVGRGLLKQAWNYASAGVNAAVGAVTDRGTEEELLKDAQQRVAENFSGTEQAVSGLSNMAEKGAKKIISKLPGTKTPADFTPEEKVKDLWDAVGKGETEQDISRGHGAFMGAVGGHVISDLEQEGKGVRPEEVAKLAPGDPFSFWSFGKLMHGAGKVVKAATPEVVSGALAKAGTAITENAAKVGGKAIETAGDLTQMGAKATEVGAKYGLPVAGAVYGAAKGGPVGVLPGIAGGQVAARTVTKVAQAAGKAGAAAEDLGQQVSGVKPLVSPYAQLTKDVIESAPGTIADIGKGVAADIGIAAVTAENPHDTEGVGLGAAIGALHGGAKVFKHAVSGQIIAPRSYGSKSPVQSSGNFPQFDAMHSQAIQDAAPGVTERLNAVRQFAKGAAPGTDVFLAKDAASLQATLESMGVASENAKALADQDGFFAVDAPAKDGTLKRVIVAKNIEAAPHEAYHAVQDVLGETANRQIDEIVKKEYANQWDQEGARYAKRLDDSSDPAKWRDTVLDWSGMGRSEAAEKLYQDIANEVRTATGADPDPAFVKDRVTGEWNKRIADAQAANPSATPQEVQAQVWRDILTPEEQTAASDRYLARELAAENFDMVFKHGPEGKSLPEKLAKIVANVSSALGGEPLSDRRSAIGKLQPKFKVTQAVKKSIPAFDTAKPEIKVGPKPSRSVPSTDEARVDAAKEAKDLADGADEAVPAGKTTSPKEILGTVAEAISQQVGVKVNYHSAPGEPAAATSSNRETRRSIIESFRNMPKDARPLWEKNFFPERVVKTKTGYQVMGWAPEVFAANAHKLAKTLSEVNPKLSPYEIDSATGSFTQVGWKSLYEDVQRFTKNQMAGRTGAGESLVVPASVTEKGAFAPQVKPGAEPLAQDRADFINLLFNFRLPDNPRVQKGKLPLNIIGQEVSEATKPGRTAIPIRPRGEFSGKEAQALGIEGRDIKEVNPLRQQIEAEVMAKGKAMPEMIEAIQRLNLENINDVQLAPEQPQFRGNTLTLTAGFQPPSEEVRKSGKEFIESPAVKMPTGEIYKGAAYHGDAIQKAVEAGHYDFDFATDGFVTNEGRFLNREEAYKLATESGQMKPDDFRKRGGQQSTKLESTIFREVRQFQPKTAADHMDSLKNDDTWKEVVNWPKGKFGGGLTGWAFERGAEAKTPEDLAAFRSADQFYSGLVREALATGNFDAASKYMGRAQAAHEAYQAATGVNRDGGLQGADFIQNHYDPKYQPPLPDPKYLKSQENKPAGGIDKGTNISDNGSMIQAQPKQATEVADLAEEYAKDAGIDYAPPTGSVAYDRDLGKRIAKFYDEAVHSPEDPEVQKSYDAFKQEVLAQYNAIKAAGYDLEPVTSVESPYKNGADVAKDVQDNKHLAFNLSESAFGQEGQGAHQLMLESTGIKAHDKELSYNDMFRAIHDFFGHAKEGLSFGPRGEFNAWREHSALFSEEAQGALAAETIGQTAWTQLKPSLLNDKGELIRPGEKGFVPRLDRPYAQQKNIVMPADLLSEARGAGKSQSKQFDAAPEQKVTAEDMTKLFGIAETYPAEELTGNSWLARDGYGVILETGFYHDDVVSGMEGLTAPTPEQRVEEFQDKTGAVRLATTTSLRTLMDFGNGDLGISFSRKLSSAQVTGIRKLLKRTIESHSDDSPIYGHVAIDYSPVDGKKVGLQFENPQDRGKIARFLNNPLSEEFSNPQFQPFASSEFDKELEKISTGENFGQTFTPGGKVWSSDKDSDIVTLASTNIPLNSLDRDTVEEALAPYQELLKHPNVVAGVFAFERDGKKMVSIDLNAVVPQKHRENSEEFAKANNQISIWDATKLEEVKTGGTGDTVLKTPEQILKALPNLVAGKPVKFDDTHEEGQLPGFERVEAKSSKEIADMTKAELRSHFPEAVVPNSRNESIPSDIVGSPLFKDAGSEEKAVEAFAKKMVEFARSWEDHPSYQAGKQWYSEFSPLLKKTFGADAPLMAELLAATSPQTSVETNFGYAHDALQSIKSGRFDKIIQKFEQGLAMLEDDRWEGWYNKELNAGNIPEPPANPTEAAFLEAWIHKHNLKPRQSNGKLYGQHSLPVLQVFARRWLDLNKGPKTRNFVANLLGDGHEATIDLWADRTMRRLGYADSKERWRILPNNKSGVSDADFEFSQKVFRKAADELGMNPDDLQGAMWFAEKQLWADNGWGRLDLGDFRKEMEKVPMLRKGYEQRLTVSKNKAKAKPEEQIDLLDLKPRRIAQ